MKPAINISCVASHPASNHVTLWSQRFFLVELQPGIEERTKCEIHEICPLADFFLFQKDNLSIKGEYLRNCVIYGYIEGLTILGSSYDLRNYFLTEKRKGIYCTK